MIQWLKNRADLNSRKRGFFFSGAGDEKKEYEVKMEDENEDKMGYENEITREDDDEGAESDEVKKIVHWHPRSHSLMDFTSQITFVQVDDSQIMKADKRKDWDGWDRCQEKCARRRGWVQHFCMKNCDKKYLGT